MHILHKYNFQKQRLDKPVFCEKWAKLFFILAFARSSARKKTAFFVFPTDFYKFFCGLFLWTLIFWCILSVFFRHFAQLTSKFLQVNSVVLHVQMPPNELLQGLFASFGECVILEKSTVRHLAPRRICHVYTF